jgi:hypothetical protein
MTSPGWIVCGFYTPDYEHWASRLRASLFAFGAPHDLVPRAKLPGGWEVNTMAKPLAVREAMARHPDKVVIFLDVDCQVLGDLSPLAKTTADVAFYVRARRRSGGGTRFGVRSGTLVLRPTEAARKFVDAWVILSEAANYGDVDQVTLMLAIGAVPGVSFEALTARWCATPDDAVSDAIILHDQASRDAPKVSALQRAARGLWRRMVRTPAANGAPCIG